MPKLNIKVTVKNEETNESYEIPAILHEDIIKYIEKNDTTVIFDYDSNSLVRENEELRMNYLFDMDRNTEGSIQIKEIGQTILVPIETNKIERKNNDIRIEFHVEGKEFLYQIEEIK